MPLDDITIPEVEITKGWLVSELETVEDCDDALAFLTESVASCDAQLALYDAGALERPAQWRANTRTALYWRKHAREVVYQRRAMLRSQERRAVEMLKQHYPQVWETVFKAAATGEANDVDP